MWLLLISILDITLQIMYLSDDDDINRQRRTLFVQGNIIMRKFNMCTLGVKLTLFRTYSSPTLFVYNTTLVELQISTITKLQIDSHNMFYVSWHVQIWKPQLPMHTFDIQCYQSVIRKLVYGLMCRLDSSVNCIIKNILATDLRYTSRTPSHIPLSVGPRLFFVVIHPGHPHISRCLSVPDYSSS